MMHKKTLLLTQVVALVLLVQSGALCAKKGLDFSSDDRVPFFFVKKPLMSLLEQNAPQGAQLIYPQKAADLEILKNQFVTYLPHTPTTPRSSAWNLIKTFLALSGFGLVSRDDQLRIVREQSIEGGAVRREPLPVYVGELPTIIDDSPIMYIQYLRSLEVPNEAEKQSHPLSKMVQELLSSYGFLTYNQRSNLIIIIDRATHVQAAAQLLTEFDKRGVTEEVAYVPLRYLAAHDVVALFTSLKIASEETQERSFIRTDPKADAITYYTQDTRIVADPIRNGVFLMGRKAHVDKIIEFITELFDKPQDKGDSILHAFPLQYLDNKKIAPLLTQIVTFEVPKSQATQDLSSKPQFEGVAIAAEEGVIPKAAYETEKIIIEQKGFPEIESLENRAVEGGNRLIIAARKKDWLTLRTLLESIDTPQDQVLLEVLIVEFTYDHRTKVAGSVRNKTETILPNGVEFLASHITSVNSVLGPTPTQLAEDLLQVIGPASVSNQVEPGSLLLSLNDPQTPGIFGLLELLDRVLSAKINAYPYITIKNHEEGILDSTETRRTTGDNTISFDGSFTIPIEDVAASITIHAKPHIISDTEVRLTVGFTINDFIAPGSFTRQTKDLRTTATVKSGEILAMGGLMRFDVNDQSTYSPFLGRIPVLGAFFRKLATQTVQRNITIFVMPTILKSRRQQQEYTQDFISHTRELMDSTLPPSHPRDPIFRIFLNENRAADIDSYLTHCSGEELPQLLKPVDSIKQAKPMRPFDAQKLKRVLACQRNFIGRT